MNQHITSQSNSNSQQQEPALESSKARFEGEGGWDVPAGYVLRQGHRLVAKPVRHVGAHDGDVLQLALASFGFLMPHGHCVIETLATFAARIELHYSGAKARRVSDTLHRLSA